jgi:hypothetical protein
VIRVRAVALPALAAAVLARKAAAERAAERRREAVWAKVVGREPAAVSPLVDELAQLRSAAHGVAIEAAGAVRARWTRLAASLLPNVKIAYEEGELVGRAAGIMVGERETRQRVLRLVANNPAPGDHHYHARHAAG